MPFKTIDKNWFESSSDWVTSNIPGVSNEWYKDLLSYDTFEIFEGICSKGEKGWRNNDTCYFRSGSKYHFVRFVKDEVEHKGWVARTYLFKDINGTVYVSPDSQGNTIALNTPKYSVSPKLSASNTEYCTQLAAALLLDNLSDERRGEFETMGELSNRIDNKRQLIEESGWKDKVYVTTNNVSLDYDIDSQTMSFKVYNDFPDIEFSGYGAYDGCKTKYGLVFTAEVDDRDYGLFSAKGDWDYADFGLSLKMDRNEAKLLKETLNEADKSIVLYTGIELISSEYGYDFFRRHRDFNMDWDETKSVRRFIGDLKYFVNKLKEYGVNDPRWKVNMYFKSSFACTSFLMILFGLSLSIRRPRSNLAVGVGISILVIFIYYAAITTGRSLGYKGTLDPFISVWITNIIFFILGSILFRKIRS